MNAGKYLIGMRKGLTNCDCDCRRSQTDTVGIPRIRERTEALTSTNLAGERLLFRRPMKLNCLPSIFTKLWE
jgi:hypothetical protein